MEKTKTPQEEEEIIIGEIRIPSDEELIRQIAAGPEDTFNPSLNTKNQAGSHRIYLESQKEILVELLLAGEPLSEDDRRDIAHLLSPELYLPPKKPAHRPKNTEKTRHRDFRIYLEYNRLYQKGESESALVQLQNKEGFKDRSSILKAINRVKNFIGAKSRGK